LEDVDVDKMNNLPLTIVDKDLAPREMTIVQKHKTPEFEVAVEVVDTQGEQSPAAGGHQISRRDSLVSPDNCASPDQNIYRARFQPNVELDASTKVIEELKHVPRERLIDDSTAKDAKLRAGSQYLRPKRPMLHQDFTEVTEAHH